jgi:hypothetical protein
VFDQQGVLWFTAEGSNFVGRLDPRTGKIDLKRVPTEDASPYGMVITSKGIPIFCEFGSNKLAKIDPKTMEITEIKLPGEGTRPRRIAITRDDTIYFTDYEQGRLGRFNPATGEVKFWPSPGGPQSSPYGITVTPDGMVWYSEADVLPKKHDGALRSEDGDLCVDDYSLWRRGGAEYGGDAGRPRIHCVQRRQQSRRGDGESGARERRSPAFLGRENPPGLNPCTATVKVNAGGNGGRQCREAMLSAI